MLASTQDLACFLKRVEHCNDWMSSGSRKKSFEAWDMNPSREIDSLQIVGMKFSLLGLFILLLCSKKWSMINVGFLLFMTLWISFNVEKAQIWWKDKNPLCCTSTLTGVSNGRFVIARRTTFITTWMVAVILTQSLESILTFCIPKKTGNTAINWKTIV